MLGRYVRLPAFWEQIPGRKPKQTSANGLYFAPNNRNSFVSKSLSYCTWLCDISRKMLNLSLLLPLPHRLPLVSLICWWMRWKKREPQPKMLSRKCGWWTPKDFWRRFCSFLHSYICIFRFSSSVTFSWATWTSMLFTFQNFLLWKKFNSSANRHIFHGDIWPEKVSCLPFYSTVTKIVVLQWKSSRVLPSRTDALFTGQKNWWNHST